MVLVQRPPRRVLRTPRPTKGGDAFLERARRALGTDEAKLEWMIKLPHIDVGDLPDDGVAELCREAWFILQPGHRGAADLKMRVGPAERELWKRVQQDVHAFLWHFARSQFHVYKISTVSDPVTAALTPATAWPSGEEWEWVFFRGSRGRLERRFHGTLPTGLVFAAADLLDRVGCHRLKACPLKINDHDCGRLFLARRGQKFCSRQHAARAAWVRWLNKHHGGTRAKSV